MKTEFIDVSPTRKQLVFEIPAETVETEIARVAGRYGRSARIPGFRPGKAPARVVRQRFRDQILHDVVHDVVPRAVDEALRERGLDPVATPDIRDVTIEEGRPLSFTAHVETVPPLEPVDYSSITLRRGPVEVADVAVDAAIERLRDRQARFEPVGGRPSQKGDFLSADVERRVVRAAAAPSGPSAGAAERHENVTIELGSATNPPGFDEPLTGLDAGATRTFTVAFPADYTVADIAGTDVEYTVHVKAVKVKVLPSIDDDFARDLGEFGSLAELRDRVRADLRRDAERAQQRELRGDLLRQLAARVPFDAPGALVARELDRRAEDLVRGLLMQRIDPARAGMDWERFREEQRPAAEEAVKSLLALDDVARRERIVVTEDEIAGELERLALRSGRDAATVRARLEQEGEIGHLLAGLRREKAAAFVEAHATIVSV